MPKTSRKIAAILAADVVGYSRLMGADDERTLAALKALRLTFDRLVGEHDGQVFGSVGDSLMAQFASAVNAVRCARSIQRAVAESGESRPADERLALRIGVNLGDVLEEDGALFGDGVNVAARLQALAEPGGILLSSAVYEQVRNRLDGRFINAGTRHVKNIAEPVRVFALTEPEAAGFPRRVLDLLWRQEVIAAVVYVAAAWTLLAMFPRFAAAARVPAWTRPVMLTMLAIGFVAVIAQAWRFNPRRPTAPWVRWLALGVAAVAAATVTGSAWLEHSRLAAEGRLTRPVPAAQPVVAVGEIRNLTGDPALDWMGEGIANLVRDRLAESRHLVVVSPTRWQSVQRTADTPGTAPADVLDRAQRAGIGYVLSGALLRDPEGLFLSARLSDVEHGVDLQAYGSGKSPDAAMLLRQATPLAMMIKRALNVPYTESVAVLAADFPTQNMLAYEAYVSGIGSVLQFDYRSAEHSFRAALQLEPSFHMARYRLALVQVAGGDTEAALTTLEEIPADAGLTPRERGYIDGARALFARDAGRAMQIYSTLLEQYPFDTEARFLLAQAHDVANDNEGAIAELKRLLQQEPENEFVWSSMAETYLRIGRYDLARDALGQYLKLEPGDPFGLTKLGQLDQLTGNPDGAAGHFRDALELRPDFLPARLALAQTDVVRGNWPEADRALSAIVEDAGAPVISRIDAAFDLSGLRRAGGQFAASIEPLVRLEEQIRSESIREARALAERSRAEAELGRFEAATELADRAIERSPGASTRYLFARGMVLLLERRADEVPAVAAAIRSQQLPPDDTLAREDADRAAAYLEGMMALAAGHVDRAVTILGKVDSMPGYQYAVYKLGLARALLEQGRPADALEPARAASTQRDPGDLRLDLELDRSRALLVESQILLAMGEQQAAADLAHAFLERWSRADPAAGDRMLAQQLAGRSDATAGGR